MPRAGPTITAAKRASVSADAGQNGASSRVAPRSPRGRDVPDSRHAGVGGIDVRLAGELREDRARLRRLVAQALAVRRAMVEQRSGRVVAMRDE